MSREILLAWGFALIAPTLALSLGSPVLALFAGFIGIIFLVRGHFKRDEGTSGRATLFSGFPPVEVLPSSGTDGPDLVIGYVDAGMGQGIQHLAIQNDGPGMAHGIQLAEISIGSFRAKFNEINFLKEKDHAYFPSSNNQGTKRPLVEALEKSEWVGLDANWLVLPTPITLTCHTAKWKFKYVYGLNYQPLSGQIEIRFKRRAFLGKT
jgi:hypothetical protein